MEMWLGGAWSVKKIKPASFVKVASKNPIIQAIESRYCVTSLAAATAEILKLGIKNISAPITKVMKFHLKTSSTKFLQRSKIKQTRSFLIFVHY